MNNNNEKRVRVQKQRRDTNAMDSAQLECGEGVRREIKREKKKKEMVCANEKQKIKQETTSNNIIHSFFYFTKKRTSPSFYLKERILSV